VNCQEARNFIHAYSDGELDLVTTLEIEKHISDCSQCARINQGLSALRSSIRDSSPYYRAPAGLERRIRSQVKQARTQAARYSLRPARWLAAAAALAIVAAAVWVVLRGAPGRSDELLASEVASAHIRSLMAESVHLWDVKSTDQHTVKPWFDGKIDFAPDVRDFKADSYALEGGRLDYLAGRPVAALVYRHEKHYINLFIWPADGQGDQGEAVASRQGYLLAHWVRSGMNYWAVSDMSKESMQRFTSLVQSPASPTTRPNK
jgi:anti-sigma factor RsiW